MGPWKWDEHWNGFNYIFLEVKEIEIVPLVLSVYSSMFIKLLHYSPTFLGSYMLLIIFCLIRHICLVSCHFSFIIYICHYLYKFVNSGTFNIRCLSHWSSTMWTVLSALPCLIPLFIQNISVSPGVVACEIFIVIIRS